MAGRAKLRLVTARDELDQMIEPWEWTVSPDANIDLDVGVDRDDVMGKVHEALEADLRATASEASLTTKIAAVSAQHSRSTSTRSGNRR